MAVYEIPLQPGTAQTLDTELAGVPYRLALDYVDEVEGGWTLDIATEDGVSLVAGIPLVTGADLLEQYAYLGIGVKLFVLTAGDTDATPTFDGLGLVSKLYFEDAL